MQLNIRKYLKHLTPYIITPFVLEIIIESLNRKSVIDGFGYMFNRPLLFMFNTMIKEI